MARSEFETIEQLNDAWDRVVQDHEETPHMESEFADTLSKMSAVDDVPPPDPAFGRRLWQQLVSEATPALAQEHVRASTPRRSIWGLFSRPAGWSLASVAAGVVLVFAVGLYLAASQPKPVSAEEIVRKAQEVASSPAALGVTSFVSTEKIESGPGLRRPEGYAGVARRWYQAPNLWRIEESGTMVDSQGKPMPDRNWSGINLSDGKSVWSFDAKTNVVQVNELGTSPSGKPDSYGGESPLGQDAIDPGKALQTINPKIRPTLRGEETVAGRTAYVLEFPPETRSASIPDINGPRTVWIDKETYFVLKVVQTSGVDGKVVSTLEVTSIQYNGSVDPAIFSFTPPQGAKVEDYRPKPAPTKDQFTQQMEALAKQADFPLFAPSQVPGALAPHQPRWDSPAGLELEYAPAGETSGTSPSAIRIVEQRATTELVTNWTEGAESTSIAGSPAWVRRGSRAIDGTGTDSGVIVVRDGTMISVNSFTASPEDLIAIAASLAPVPGGHAALPNPTVPVRTAVPTPKPVPSPGFTVLRPTWLPEQLTTREAYEVDPTGKGTQVVIGFDPRPEDQKPHGVLTLAEMAKGALTVAGQPDPEETHETIGGRDVRVIWRGDNWITLTWEQGDVALVLTNPYDPPGHPRYTPDQLRRIVESIR